MASTLHILTRTDDALPQEIINIQRVQDPSAKVGIFDLTAPEPDYSDLLEMIFEAESVTVW